MSDTDPAPIAEIATKLEAIATWAEDVMPKAAQLRSALGEVAPRAATFAGYEGPEGEFAVAAEEGYGFFRLDTARRRLIAALHDPMDDVPLPED